MAEPTISQITKDPKEAARERNRSYYEENKERCKEIHRQYRENNRERIRERSKQYSRQYRSQNPERVKESFKKWYYKNREGEKERKKQYYFKNQELIKQYNSKNREHRKEYLSKNPERIKAWRKQYAATHKVQILIKTNRERARKKSNTVIQDETLIAAFYKNVRKARRIKCHWCKQYVKKSDRSIDHIIPLAKGGLHQAVNLCCACKRCNFSKQARLPQEITQQGFLSFTEKGPAIPCQPQSIEKPRQLKLPDVNNASRRSR
jgi:hypothetical protein